ncbi:hypothetical protein Hanom_Chr15g01376531 [Helianthus anomalus]
MHKVRIDKHVNRTYEISKEKEINQILEAKTVWFNMANSLKGKNLISFLISRNKHNSHFRYNQLAYMHSNIAYKPNY